MGIVLLIVGIVILLAAIISPLSIIIGGVIGIAFIVVGTVIQIKKRRIKLETTVKSSYLISDNIISYGRHVIQWSESR